MNEDEQQKNDQHQEDTHEHHEESSEGAASENSASKNEKSNTPWVIAAILVVVVVLLGVLYQTGRLSGLADMMGAGEAVARVNDETITERELEEEFAPTREQINSVNTGTSTDRQALIESTKQQVLNQMINETILLSKAEEAGIEVTDEEVDQEFETAKQQVMSQQAQFQGQGTSSAGQSTFEQQLETAGYTVAEYRAELREQVIISQYLMQNVDMEGVSVSDEEVQQMYDQYSQNPNIAQDQIPPLSEVRESLVQQLTQQKERELVNAFVEELRSEAEVEILLGNEDSQTATSSS